jgi:glycerophosphoryl diester phosphodiesterase
VILRILRALLTLLALFAIVAFVLNTNLLAPKMEGRPRLLAHRGLAQTFPPEGIENDTCTATRIRPPEHEFLENTIASMRAAFAAGADVVEFDIHPTTDGHFVVFHDWTLDCRTNGKGVTREKTLAELKALDIGYGYTADGGNTFPFRGTGVGLMPTLDEVLTTFPDKRFLIHVKSRDAAEGRLLAARLSRLPDDALARLAVYGDDTPLATLREILPHLRVMARGTLVQCLSRYLAVGWGGYVPAACRNTMLLVPSNYAWVLWGWPSRFLARLQGAGTEVYLLGPYTGGDFSTGVDTALDVAQLPDGYNGGIWTNRIHAVAPLMTARRD